MVDDSRKRCDPLGKWFVDAGQILSALIAVDETEAAAEYRRRADDFEEALLGKTNIPTEFRDLFVKLVSEEPFLNANGIWNFVVRLFTDSGKLSKEDLGIIGAAFVRGFPKYRDERMSLVVADFVARCFDPPDSLTLLEQISSQSLSKTQRGALQVAAETVSRNVDRDAPVGRRAQELCLALGVRRH